jgi:tetratricopeptide (TPR) repeat protein
MLWEHPDYDDVDQSERFWRQYLDDLASLPDLGPAERAIAQAMVWERIGRIHVAYSQYGWECAEDEDGIRRDDRGDAVACFREAIRLAPGLRRAHQSLADAYQTWGQDEEAAETYRRLLDQSPDDLDALKFLFRHHSDHQEPIAARDHALRAQRLKPANPEILTMAWIGRVAAARQLALEGKFDLGRAEFAAADRLGVERGEPYHLVACKAIFEYKAGDAAAGKRLADEAIGSIEEPAPALLTLLIEAIRYDLPFRLGGVMSDLEWQLQRSLSRKRSGRTAGRLCRIMTEFLTGKLEYPGRAVHLEQVLGYVDRCGKVRWEAGDLRDVCLFLRAVPDELRTSPRNDLLTKLVRRGLKKFPETPEFPLMAGGMELAKGSRRCNRKLARRYLELARDLAKKAGPDAAALVEMAEHSLAFLDEVGFSPPMPVGSAAGRFDEDDAGDDHFNPFENVPRGKLFAEFVRACKALGLDPEQVLNDAAAGKPFRFSPPGGGRG